jgi:Carbohydrate family 9 binding domain-like
MFQRRILSNSPLDALHILRLESGGTICRVAMASLMIMSVGMPQASSQIQSKRALYDVSSDTNPDSAFWRGVTGVVAEKNANGDTVSGYQMEVRSRWTSENLYFLFSCPYVDLHLKPDPNTEVETNGLWNWDVAEVFIGADIQDIRTYKEFEISPQGEWIDLDINLNRPKDSHDWMWNSGFTVAARIDPRTHRWYGFMKIPYSSVDSRPASAGNLLRVNFFLSEGAGASHEQIAWQPTHSPSFHVPEVFGKLKLVKR